MKQATCNQELKRRTRNFELGTLNPCSNEHSFRQGNPKRRTSNAAHELDLHIFYNTVDAFFHQIISGIKALAIREFAPDSEIELDFWFST